MLACSTDYVDGRGSAELYLREIAKAGFTHVHWCQEWNSDYFYTDKEIAQICTWLNWYRLRVTDLHASAGETMRWGSSDPRVCEEGVALVKNRIRMVAMLGGDVAVLHLPGEYGCAADDSSVRAAVHASLDALTAFAREQGVRIALENTPDDNTAALESLFARYGADVLGLCYDSGHGHIAGNGLDRLAVLKDRLLAIHLHDNDGKSDQHRLPYDGGVDWSRLMSLIAASPYRKPLTLELICPANTNPAAFLAEARVRGARLEGLMFGLQG
jgi:sugar phosphate isomerase/epimerase